MYSNFVKTKQKEVTREKCVLFKFNYKYNDYYICPAFNINKVSKYQYEKEYLFPPFSFFRITKYNAAEGTRLDPVVIELEVQKDIF